MESLRMLRRNTIKRETDFQILSEWIEPGARVLDMGCGRGILLQHLIQTRNVYGVGVDNDSDKVIGCVKRGVPVYQGDILEGLEIFPDRFFDWVVCSHTLPELSDAGQVLQEALRVGRRLAVGFVNHGYWRNRLSIALSGSRIRNEVYPQRWEEARTSNPVSLNEFEAFCKRAKIRIYRRVCLRGDWKTPCRWLPELRAGYLVYEIGKEDDEALAADVKQ